MVPGAGFEPATFGLQNRCTTTVLTRPGRGFSRRFWPRAPGTFVAIPGFRCMGKADDVATLPALPDAEVQRLAAKFEVSPDEVRLAAKRAGSTEGAIEAELRRQATS